MLSSLKIAAIQMNPTVGDLDGNFSIMMTNYALAVADGAQLVVFPEMAMTGYPLQDLVRRPDFIAAATRKSQEFIDTIAASGAGVPVIFGTVAASPTDRTVVFNQAWAFNPKSGDLKVYSKSELPNYGVFDEKRDFTRSEKPELPFEVEGIRVGVLICEDTWFPTVADMHANNGADLLVSINGSPFEQGKDVVRRKIVSDRIDETGLPLVYVNLVGGQDELVFDGGSFAFDGNSVQTAAPFSTGVTIFEMAFSDFHITTASMLNMGRDLDLDTTSYQAMVLGLRDYMRKNGFKTVVIGYSGGVDSGLVAAIACDAIGPQNVHLVRLPSKFSSDHSLTDAEEGAIRLGAKLRTIRIEPIVQELRTAYWSQQAGYNFYDYSQAELSGVADENIQSRTRGTILMSISNQEGHLLLSTGNRSECFTGYFTAMGGDSNGGFNPIKDCYKTQVWRLCRLRNGMSQDDLDGFGFLGRATTVVPEEIISKPPSAELRANQVDTDSLPDYPILDQIIQGLVDERQCVQEVVATTGIDADVVQRIRNLIDGAEYKRRLAPPGVKIGANLDGRDRRYPITNRWRG